MMRSRSALLLIALSAGALVPSCSSDSADTSGSSGSSDLSNSSDSSSATEAESPASSAQGADSSLFPAPSTATSCTVSALLVPSCGSWLGASTPSKADRLDYVAGLVEYETVARDQPDIQHFYKRDRDAFPTELEVSLSERPGQQRSLLFYNWKPSTSLTWAEVAHGAADSNIDTVAASISRYPHRLFLAIHHEPENDERDAGSGMTAADFVDMYRHVVGRLRDLHVDNVVYVMNYTGFANWAPAVDRFYPGDDVVDWIAYDPYGLARTTDFATLLNDPADDWPGFYQWAIRKAPGKPIMVAEWGFDLNSQPNAATALETAPRVLAEQFPMIKALVYWNDHAPGGFEVRLDQNSELGQAYGRAYSTFANAAYFDLTSTASAP
jgi:hypothetical protein